MTPRETPPKNTNHEDSVNTMISIFVYGTLKRGYANHDRFCHNAIDIQPATVLGRLYDLGAYPALEVPDESILARHLRPARRRRHPGPPHRPHVPTRPQHLAPRRLGPHPRRTHHLPQPRPRPTALGLPRRLPPWTGSSLPAHSGHCAGTGYGCSCLALCRRTLSERMRRTP
jgi:hypothetical protein